MMGPFEILSIIGAIFLFLYYYSVSKHNFWKNQGVKGPKPLPFLGNFKDVILNRYFLGEFAKRIYDEFEDESMIGIYASNTPILMVKDPAIIKNVMIKDFNKFADRGFDLQEKVDVLTPNLFFLEPKRWRPIRRSLTPAFTSGKMKEMFHLLLESSNHLEKYLENIVNLDEPIECRQLTAKFTTDVIGSCVFGIDVNSLTENNNEFVRMGRAIFDPSFGKLIRFRIKEFLPWLYNFLGPIMAETEINNFFINLVKDTMEYRKKNNYVRHDFIDLLREVKENPDKLGDDIELTDSLLAAQAFVFFAAGFETSATTMANALYELAQNQLIQDKLRAEIRDEFVETNGKLVYDRINHMPYLDQVFKETLRKYPPVALLTRKSTEPHTFPGTNVTLPKDSRVWIPTFAIHRDPKIYPDPDTFDPERFEEDAVKSRNPMFYLPFGDGPRNCIGARFAVYQTKIGLIKILKDYKVDVCKETPFPYVINTGSFLLQPKGTIHLQFSKAT